MAMNAADPHHYSFNEELLPLAVESQMGIIGMKVPGRSRLLSSWTPPPIEAAEALLGRHDHPDATPGTLTMREAMYYTLSRPVSTVIIGCDTIAQLEENVQLAREFTPLSDKQATRTGSPRRARPQAIALLPLLRPPLTRLGKPHAEGAGGLNPRQKPTNSPWASAPERNQLAGFCTRYSSSISATSTQVGTETMAPTTPSSADPSSNATRMARLGRPTLFPIMRGVR